MERAKGTTWNENLLYKSTLSSEANQIPAEDNIILSLSAINGNIYTAPKDRFQADSQETELSNVNGYYDNWTIDFCGQTREISTYVATEDASGTVIGLFTLESPFNPTPSIGTSMNLRNPATIEDVNQTVMRTDSGGQVQIGGANDVAVIHNGGDGFVGYDVELGENQVFLDFSKPLNDSIINVTTFCTAFGVGAAGGDAFVEQIGIYLDSVPAGTKARIILMGVNQLDIRYPLLQNVTIDQLFQGLGDDVSVSIYADETTWNLLTMEKPTVARVEQQYTLIGFFTDANGDPVVVPVPVSTAITDIPFIPTVRSNNIQSASGTAITLDVGADPTDDIYNGMRLYINSEFRTILYYDGTTKIATVDSVYTTPPNPSDPYDIKIAFIRPLITYKYRDTKKGQIQTAHNRRAYSLANDGQEICIGTVNYTDSTGGPITFTVPVQVGEFLGAWFDIIDISGTFATNNVTIDFNEFDNFEGNFDTDYVCDVANMRYRFRYVDDSFGWTVEKFQIFKNMYEDFDNNTYIGNTTSGNLVQITNEGDIIHQKGGGMACGGISVEGNTNSTALTKDTWAQFLFFDTNDASNQLTPDYTQGHITATLDGIYYCSMSVSYSDGANTTFELEVKANNGTISFPNVHNERKLGQFGDIGCVSGSGLITLTAGDTPELWVQNISNDNDVIIKDATLTLIQIAGKV